VGFSGTQQLSFPALNTSNTTNSMFVLLTLAISICFVDFDHSYSFSQGSFVSNFYTCFFQFALLCSTFCFFYISKEFVGVKKIVNFEYELIISFSILGLALINICDDFLILYLAIELQSLCFYVLATFNKNSEYCAEAGVKYFVLGAFSSGLLLFGFTLFYASFGAISFESIERTNSLLHCLIAFCGCLFFSTAILFKLGSFPFHMWLCDVYDGSIINITAFFSTIPKVILLSFFIKTLYVVFSGNLDILNYILIASGLGSICFASVAALYQKRIKRLMAYSTVSHTGFLLLGICCSTVDSIKACTIYIILYILMTLTLFSILFISGIDNNQQKYLIN
jgi:NADH-quinone oxidoreductase subunit N